LRGARGAIVAFSLIATLVSAYLTWVHYSGSLALCIGVGGCEAVQTSRYSMVGAVPVALLGFIGCSAILAAAVAYARANATALIVLFALSLGATLYLAYLTYLEVFVLGAICPWCVSVALCVTAVLALAAREVFASPD
jgi:uncharacterized membrane protein